MLKIPPPIWAFLYLALAGAVSTAYPWHPIVTPAPFGIALVATGFTISFLSVWLFLRRGAQLNPASETHTTLVVNGPFRFTRNPMYLGLVVLTLGLAFWVGSPPMFAVPFLVFATTNWVHIPYEEARMRQNFGEAYDAYRTKTRRWL